MTSRTVHFLEKEKVILYPTDTIWGIGCDATNELAVRKIYKIKQRKESKSLIVLVNSFEMLQEYVKIIPKEIITYLKTRFEPTTVIYNNPINLAKNVIAKDNTVAIRIVNEGFCYELITAFGKPIVSTSANISGDKTVTDRNSISKSIINNVDFVVNLPKYITSYRPSRIIRFENDEIKVLRD